MKLRSTLSLQSTSDLRQIATNTGLPADSVRNKSELVDLCCRHLSKPAQVRDRMKALNSAQTDFITTLAAEGGELLEAEAIEELCGGLVHRFHDILISLSGVGLVFQDRESLGPDHNIVGIPEPLLKTIPVPPSHQKRLRTVMKPLSIGHLRAFASQAGTRLFDHRRPFVIQAIRDHLLDPDRLRDYVNSLSDEKRAILNELLKSGETTQETVRQNQGEDAVRQLSEMIRKTPIFLAQETDSARDRSPIHLASDISSALQALADSHGGNLESRPEEFLEEGVQAPKKVKENASSLFRDLANLLGLLARRRPSALKTGGIAKPVLREARRNCKEEDPGYTEYLMLFIEEAGMARPEAGVWRPGPDAGEKLEGKADIQKSMFAFWQETDRWNEWSAEASKRKSQRSRMMALKDFRQEILQGLRKCPVDRWISYPKFYSLLLKSSEPFRNHVQHPNSGRTLATGGTTVEELLRRTLSGVLVWIGLIELGNPELYELPLHRNACPLFRITRAGDELLRGAFSERPIQRFQPTNPEARIVLQPNLEVLSPPDLPHAAYIKLWTLADLKSVDIVTHFQITRDSLREGMNAWTSGDAIRQFLVNCSSTGIPEVLEKLIQECESRHGEIEIGRASGYLVVGSEDLLDELYAQKSVAALMGLRTSPRSGILKAHARPEVLVQMLQKEGYMPKLIDESINTHDGHLQLALKGSDLSELVAFLETATKMLRDHASDPPRELDHLLSRLRRGLRQLPDQQRLDARSRYERAFEKLLRPASGDTGVHDLLRYAGKNPSSDPKEIRSMFRYAIDHHLCLEIHYPSIDARRVIEPAAEDPTMLYAFCRERNGDRVFRIEKVGLARLTGDRFESKHRA